MNEVKNALLAVKTNSKLVFSWRYAFPLVYFSLMTLGYSGFGGSLFMNAYLVLLPILFIGYYSLVFARAWRTVPAGLSVKALLLLSRKRIGAFVFMFAFLTISTSLLYAVLAHPFVSISHQFYLWIVGLLTFFLSLVLGIVWMKERHRARKSAHTATPVPMSPPLQQQKRP